jgi:hypothetical protein
MSVYTMLLSLGVKFEKNTENTSFKCAFPHFKQLTLLCFLFILATDLQSVVIDILWMWRCHGQGNLQLIVCDQNVLQ